MTPREKFEQLSETYTSGYIAKVAENMTLYYTGKGIEELRTFWSQVYELTQ